jgi:hypothetical protein
MNPILLTLALLHGADLASTQVVLHQGGSERNPLMPQAASWNLAIGSAASAGDIWLLHRIGRSHPRLATVIGIAAIGAEGFAVVHNVRQVKR